MPTLEARPFKITKPVITKLLNIIDAGLISGGGNRPEPGKICVEQAVCLALDLPHSDDPLCVSRALRRVKMSLNDSNWSSNTARANGLRKLAIAQLGTRDVLDDVEFTKKLAELTIRKMVPRALRIVAALPAVQSHSEKLEAAAVTCEQQGTSDAASDAARAASDAASAASAARAASAASAARAASAASYAARAARAASAASAASARDAELTFFADLVLEVLIALKVPGAKWLKYVKQPELTSAI